MDGIVDMSTATPDQAFMLMLSERLEKLEEEWTVLKEGLKKITSDPKVAPCAQALYDKLSDIYSSHRKQQVEDDVKSAEERVPKNILSKIPEHSIKQLLDALAGDVKKQSYTAYYAMAFLERYKTVDEEFIEWYEKALGL